MATRTPWDKYETAILIDACIQVINNQIDRQHAIKTVSAKLRKRATNAGVMIDEIYRNENGIRMQMAIIMSIIQDKEPGLYNASKTFFEMVELYRTEYLSFSKILKEANFQVTGSDESSNTIAKLKNEDCQINVVLFHKPTEPNGFLSNWYAAEFEYGREKYISTEQYMMYQKMSHFRAYDIADKILKEHDQKVIKDLGRTKIDNFNAQLWDKTKHAIVKRGIRAKFMQNPMLAQKLLDTGSTLLAECSKTDTQWGIGVGISDKNRFDTTKWNGQNLLGRILMEIRQELSIRRALGKLKYINYTDALASPYWKMTVGELVRIPQFYSSVHAYIDYIDRQIIDKVYSAKLSDIEDAMHTNMGGGLPAAGFWELKQDVFEIAELLEISQVSNQKKEDIHSFAVRYLEMFNDPLVNYLELESNLGEECQRLGFDMDAGESFINQYSKEAFYNADELKCIIEKVDSVELLGNGIFSYWRYITHWAGVSASLLSEENKKWFLIALYRLAELTS